MLKQLDGFGLQSANVRHWVHCQLIVSHVWIECRLSVYRDVAGDISIKYQ